MTINSGPETIGFPISSEVATGKKTKQLPVTLLSGFLVSLYSTRLVGSSGKRN